ncbi:unnamed protein product [Absidia cylindrospora]
MPETTSSKATPTPTKRRSVLGDLGIKPGSAAPPPPRSATRPSSTPVNANGASKPTPSRATLSTDNPLRLLPITTRYRDAFHWPYPFSCCLINRKTPTTTAAGTATTRARKSSTATPRPISVHGTSTSSSGTPGTPTTPTTPSRRPVSMHHQSSPAPRPSATPMSRRASLNPSSSQSGTSTPRLTSPVESELKALQEKIAQKDALMEEQDTKVKALQQQLATQNDTDQEALKKANEHIDSLQKQVEEMQTQKDTFEKEKLKLKLELVSKDNLDQVLEEQAKQAQAQVEALMSEHQQETEKLALEHDRQLNDLKTSMEATQQNYETMRQDYDTLQSEHTTLTEQHQTMQAERDTFSQKAADMEAMLASSKEAHHVRDLEQQLATARQATEALERRFRDEMQQTQNDHDDTAQTWLVTHQRMQNELDRLQQEMAESEQHHALALQQAHDQHAGNQQDADDRFAQLNDDRDAQAQHIDALETQIEALQTRLEEATLRLEHHAAATATMKPSLSNHDAASCQLKRADLEHQLEDCKRQLEEKGGDTTSHESCQQKHADLEHQLDDYKRQLEQVRLDTTSHESCQQKYAELEHQLETTMAQHKQYVEEQQQAATSSNDTQNQQALDQQRQQDEEKSKAKLIDVAQQHKKEVQLLHDQYQQLVDLKDHELEAYAYRVKALHLARQKDLDSCRSESADQMHHLEHQIEGYEYLSLMI